MRRGTGHSSEQPQCDPIDRHSLTSRFEGHVRSHARGATRRGREAVRPTLPGSCRSRRAGSSEGKTIVDSDQVISAKTTSQLQLRPIRMPAIRPMVNVGLTDSGGQRPTPDAAETRHCL